jgi:hypothetical protein
VCLTFVQAHLVVPHHHHAEGQVFSHQVLGDHSDHVDSVEVGHDVAPHDEAFLEVDLKYKSIGFELTFPILPDEVIVWAGLFEGPIKVASRADHPPVHGPPRPHDSRGPPASPVA